MDYIRIRHPEKIKYDLYYPLLLAVLFCVIFGLLPAAPKIFNDQGLIKHITGMLQILTGFYIASLAAIATFNKEGMDSKMQGEPPKLTTWRFGRTEVVELTRRRFLCLMFGYLSFLSFLLYFIGIGGMLSYENVKIVFQIKYHFWIKWGFVFCYLFLLSNLVITTLLALYYMADRIHRVDSELQGGIDETK